MQDKLNSEVLIWREIVLSYLNFKFIDINSIVDFSKMVLIDAENEASVTIESGETEPIENKPTKTNIDQAIQSIETCFPGLIADVSQSTNVGAISEPKKTDNLKSQIDKYKDFILNNYSKEESERLIDILLNPVRTQVDYRQEFRDIISYRKLNSFETRRFTNKKEKKAQKDFNLTKEAEKRSNNKREKILRDALRERILREKLNFGINKNGE